MRGCEGKRPVANGLSHSTGAAVAAGAATALTSGPSPISSGNLVVVAVAMADSEGALEPEVARGAADHHAVGARVGGPAVGRLAPGREIARAEPERHVRALPGGELDLLEAAQLAWRLTRGRRVAEVELDDLGAGSRAGVRDAQRHRGAVRAARVDLQPVVAEGGVREPVAEREQRLLARGVVPAVADQDALVVARAAVGARDPLGRRKWPLLVV